MLYRQWVGLGNGEWGIWVGLSQYIWLLRYFLVSRWHQDGNVSLDFSSIKMAMCHLTSLALRWSCATWPFFTLIRWQNITIIITNLTWYWNIIYVPVSHWQWRQAFHCGWSRRTSPGRFQSRWGCTPIQRGTGRVRPVPEGHGTHCMMGRAPLWDELHPLKL